MSIPDPFKFNKKRIAEAFGVTQGAVDKWRAVGCPSHKEGRIVIFDLREVIAWRTKGFETEGGKVLNLETERARLAKEQADKATLENKRLVGELVSIKDLIPVWEAIGVALKSRLLALPGKLAPVVQTAKTVAKAKAIIDESIRDVLTELSENAPGVDPGAVLLAESEAAEETDSESVGGRTQKTKSGK